MRDDRERLFDILEAIERIEKYAAHGRIVFDKDELIQTWVLHPTLPATQTILNDKRSSACEISSFIITSTSTRTLSGQ